MQCIVTVLITLHCRIKQQCKAELPTGVQGKAVH